MENKSAESDKIFSALAKAQSEMGNAKPDKENSYLKSSYCSLASLIKASRPALTKNGLAVCQIINDDGEGNEFLVTLLCHSSGQWILSRKKISPPKSDIQTLGSYITYLRRYLYFSIVGVTTAADDDDDGEAATSYVRTTYVAASNSPKVSLYELSQIIAELEGRKDIEKMVLDGLKIEDLGDMPKDKFHASLSRIQDIKRMK